MTDSLGPNEPQYARPPCPSPTAGVHPNPCPLSRWCHPTISSSVVPSSSRLQFFPALGSFQRPVLLYDFFLLLSSVLYFTDVYFSIPSFFFSSFIQLCLILRSHGLQHCRVHCPSPAPRARSDSCPSSRWCCPTISSSVVPSSSCLQSFPASGSLPV